MRTEINAWLYTQYDADYSLEFPGEGYTGWNKQTVPIDPEHTAVVVMHAWDVGTYEQVPGQYLVCEYVPRSTAIINERLGGFLAKVRESGFNLIHIGSRSERSVESLPGYIRVREKYGLGPSREQIMSDPVLDELRRIRTDKVFYGHNLAGVNESRVRYRDFAAPVMPRDDEDVVCTSHQLFEVCKERGINHLIYTGFAVNACLTSSPCGYIDMTRRGIMCSIIRELTTAVENKESCRVEGHKEYGLWSFALWGGFVFEQADVERLFGV